MVVLITGDTGFIGTNLKNRLIEDGISVKGYAKRNGFDILDRNQLYSEADGCDLVYHLAAYTNPAESILRPEYALEVNVNGTFNVLEVCKELAIPLVYVSSCEIYGDSVEPLSEKSPLRPPNPYAATKAAADVICYSYFKCYGMDVKIIRLFNPYGPHQQLNKVIPIFYSQAKKNEPITVFADGSDTRDYVYIDDIVDGLSLARSLPPGEITNLATGIATTNLELANTVIELTESSSTVSFVDYPVHFGGIKNQIGSRARAKNLLQWEPKTPLAVGAEKCLRWLEENT